ncbi:MAG: FtsH protease activity modulator HflK [Planctomycetales bacterium]|nr:FtsH protease activity modulator HflK [Planctomycetales bacterium]
MSRGSNSNFDWGDASPQQLANMAALVFGVLVLVYVGWSSAYMVDAHEQAVVLRFGKYQTTQLPGLRFKIPGVEKRVLVDMSERSMRLPWGYAEQGGEQSSGNYPLNSSGQSDDKALILTGDLYAAVVEWNVFWRVVEPEKYIFSFPEEQMEQALIAVARSTMHRIVGDYSADETLTGKREEITLAALAEMKKALNLFDAGIEVSDLQLQRVTPPDLVKPSFDQVNASIQQRGQLIYEATRERNGLLPLARANSDKLVREAEGYADRRRAEAEGEIAALLAKYESYKLAPDITRQRMYLETMERVFATGGRKLILDEKLEGLVPLMNLRAEPN